VSFSLLRHGDAGWIVGSMWFWTGSGSSPRPSSSRPVPLGPRHLPAFRYDQIMRLGWKIFIPVTLVWLVVVGLVIQSPWNIWK
jgi:NADH-quinone oxidoreductase subunit H